MLTSRLFPTEKVSSKRPVTSEIIQATDNVKKPRVQCYASVPIASNFYDAYPIATLKVDKCFIDVISLNAEKNTADRKYYLDLSKLMEMMGCGRGGGAKWAAAQLKPKKYLEQIDSNDFCMLKWNKRKALGIMSNQTTRCLLINRKNISRLPHRSEYQKKFVLSLLVQLEAGNFIPPATLDAKASKHVKAKTAALLENTTDEFKQIPTFGIEDSSESKFTLKTEPFFNVSPHVIATLPSLASVPQGLFHPPAIPNFSTGSSKEEEFVKSFLK